MHSLAPYIPDFSVRVITPVQFLRIRRVHYLAARRTSSMMSSKAPEDPCHEEAFHTEWQRTMAAQAISRNNSAAAVSDLAEAGLSPLEMVQKCALMSEGSHKDKFAVFSGHRHAAGSKGSAEGIAALEVGTEGKGKLASADSLRANSPSGSPLASGSSPLASGGSPLGHQKWKLRASSSDSAADVVPAVTVHNGRTRGEEDGDSAPLLTNNVGEGDLKVSTTSTESESSPEEGGKGDTVVEDKVPLVSCKDARTTPSGQKGWVDDEDESSPLVSKEKEKGEGKEVKS